MKKTSQSRFVGLQSNNYQESNKLKKLTKGNPLNDLPNSMEINNNQMRPKNMWMSSFRDIICEEPVRVTPIRKVNQTLPKKNITKNESISKSKIKKPANGSSSRPVFMMTQSLKQSIDDSSTINDDENIVQESNNHNFNNQISTNNQIRKQYKIISESPVKNDANINVLHKSPVSQSNRYLSPTSNKIESQNKRRKCECLKIFLILLLIILLFMAIFCLLLFI